MTMPKEPDTVISYALDGIPTHEVKWILKRDYDALREYADGLDEVIRKISGIHASDCSLHNAPALPVGPCDCGAVEKQTPPCSCYTEPNYIGCECGNYDSANSQGRAQGWNDCLEAIDAAKGADHV